jgi:hypothetical protein
VETAPPSPSPCRRLCPGPSLLPEAPAATVRHSARFPGLSPGKHGAARPAVSRIEGGATRNRTCMPSLAPYPWREKERETDFQCEKTVRKEADKKSIFPGGSCTQPRDGSAIAAFQVTLRLEILPKILAEPQIQFPISRRAPPIPSLFSPSATTSD